MEKSEIAAVRQELGDAAITDEARSPSLIYSGDTPIEWDGRYDEAEVLIHEATFLTAAEIDPDNPKRNKHSSLDQVMKMVAGSKIKKLILGHFSSRYSNEQIDEAIALEMNRHGLSIEVRRVLPGQTVRDLLGAFAMNLHN